MDVLDFQLASVLFRGGLEWRGLESANLQLGFVLTNRSINLDEPHFNSVRRLSYLKKMTAVCLQSLKECYHIGDENMLQFLCIAEAMSRFGGDTSKTTAKQQQTFQLRHEAFLAKFLEIADLDHSALVVFGAAHLHGPMV